MNLSDGCSTMTPERRSKEIPYIAAWLAMGARVMQNYKGDKDTVGIATTDDSEHIEISRSDFDIALEISKKISQDLRDKKIVSPEDVMLLCRRASLEVDWMNDPRRHLKGIVMLKDKGGSGYWRMVFPARHMDNSGIYIDVTSTGMKYEHLLEYNTIHVQRLCDWESFYVLERLKKAGKRIVYDIDDDIFNIPKDHPASRLIGRDELIAATACMNLADEIVASTNPLAEIIFSVTGRKPLVIPNAVDMSDGWTPTPFTGSPDAIKRIFWQGGNTHGEDWRVCADAVDAILGERQDVRVVILGFLPPIVMELLQKPNWRGRVEFLEFSSTETYSQMMRHIRAEVGIAPLVDTRFNRSKSNLKFLEYTAVGIPTVASSLNPYSDTIENGVDGFLVKTSQEWFSSITLMLDDKRKRLATLEAARRKVREQYDIGKTAAIWKKALVS